MDTSGGKEVGVLSSSPLRRVRRTSPSYLRTLMTTMTATTALTPRMAKIQSMMSGKCQKKA